MRNVDGTTTWRSKRSGTVCAGSGSLGGTPAVEPRRVARSKMLPGASMRRFHTAFFTVTTPPSVGVA